MNQVQTRGGRRQSIKGITGGAPGALSRESTKIESISGGFQGDLIISDCRKIIVSMTIKVPYNRRVQRFRDKLIGELPRVPNDGASLTSLQGLSTIGLIQSYVTWRMRLIPRKPRAVRIWHGGVTPFQLQKAKNRIAPLINDAIAGNDLEQYLSESVRKAGIDLDPTRRQNRSRRDIDMVLTRHGLHHFHIGARTKFNPKGRSDALVFAEVSPDEFRIAAISDHRAFDTEDKTGERQRFFRTCLSYISKDIPPGEGFTSSPVLSSGHSLEVRAFARKCSDEMDRLDSKLDQPEFFKDLYGQQTNGDGDTPSALPPKVSLSWHFEDLIFGILDTRNGRFFPLLPYFQR